MASQKKQGTTTGNGISRTPILENAEERTAVKSRPSQKAASIESRDTASETNGTKPQSLSETVSLLQTDCFDLRSFGCKVAILTRDGKIYIAIEHSENVFGFDTDKGNITMNGVAVSK